VQLPDQPVHQVELLGMNEDFVKVLRAPLTQPYEKNKDKKDFA
jgi:hypothetical protein